jgi:squalene-associated FAD-dependent desaturase
VAIVGGGLAGMAAALALAENGCQVDLFEQKHRLGGRVGSFRDPTTGELVDYCMHVSMGCCTNFLDFIRRTGVDDCFQRHRRLTFVGPDGEICKFDSWRWLPAPLHLLPGFARLRYLTLRERLSIGRCLMRMGRLGSDDWRGKTAGAWLREQRQSKRTIERFWSVVLVSALGDTVDRVALSMARKVFLDGFMRSADGYEILLPKIPLGEIFDGRVKRRLQDLGVNIHLGSQVRSIEMNEGQAESLTVADGRRVGFDALVVAVPWTTIGRLISPEQRLLLHADWQVGQIESSEITAVHLWFDRPITSLPHAAFVGRTSDWIFRHNDSAGSASSHHYQVVISASQQLEMPREQLLDAVLNDLRSVWSETRSAQLVHHRIVTEKHAVFSTTGEGLHSRLGPTTKMGNVYLAGDWTETGWPATMEGAILSGYRAAGMLGACWATDSPFPAKELRGSWLARLFFGG